MDVQAVEVTPGPPTSAAIQDTVEDQVEAGFVGVPPALPTSAEVDECTPGVSKDKNNANPSLCMSPQDSQASVVNSDGNHSTTFSKSVRGSFHQGDDRFKYGGVQCMAISLVSLAKHTIDSVFSWQTKDVDRVVLLGDKLYTDLRDGDMISGSASYLCVPDLPRNACIDGQQFEFEFGDFVTGDVDVVEGEFIEAGVYTSLESGLQKIFADYVTCLLTLCGSTCAVICQNGEYAVFDCHARSADGMVSEKGRSVLLYFSSLEDVFSHICCLATALSKEQKPFEIAGVCVKQVKGSESVRLTESTSEESACVSGQEARRKRKISLSHCKAKKLKQYDVAQLNSDVEFVGEIVNSNLVFSPIREQVCRALCTQLNVEFEKTSVPVSARVGLLGAPCKKESIVADGNCFFRAISQAVSGTQKHHRKVRLAIVKELKKNAVTYSNILRPEYSSVSDYIEKSKMRNVNSWATEVEIQVTADYLGVDVFTFYDGRWLKYSCNGKLFSKDGIYLENCSGNHYETVVCVHEPELHSCYGYCKTSALFDKGYNTRSQSKDNSTFSFKHTMQHAKDHTQDHTFCADTAVLDTDASDEVVNDSRVTFSFNPLSSEVAQTLCCKFNVDFEKQAVKVHSVSGDLGGVCKTDKVVEDGNSFFRALSQVISGSQKSHRKIRLAVVKYMENHSEEHMTLVGNEYASVSEYVAKSQMKYVGHCATETEFQAAANALGLDIFICNGDKWQKYSCMNTALANEGIYLNCENGHFEPAICVQHFDKNVCFGLCKDTHLCTQQYISRRKTKEKGHGTSNVFSTVGNYCFSKYLKKKRYFQNQTTYQENVFHKEKLKAKSIKKYQDHVLHRQKLKESNIRKYKQNVLYRERLKEMSIRKYKQNVLHRERLKEMSIRKYKQNVLHRERLKEMSIRKYKQNVLYRERLKKMSIRKYKQNVLYRERLKEMSIRKYRSNELHRQNVKVVSTRKYHGNPEHKRRVVAGVSLKRKQMKEKAEQFDFVMSNFLDKVKDGPDFVCCVCHRLLFRHQVLNCEKSHYNMTQAIAVIADRCLTEDYLHKCNEDCVSPCHWLDTPRGKLWICYTCHYKINKGEVPPESATNNLEVHYIPPELACLNSLEQHLIALHIPFMKMLALPKGGQNGVHGPVTCVPANIVQTTNVLPRSSMEGSLLP
ncbi:uncharacterized protein LOC115775538, partial [Archocentrus centrarchus]|uniref:uncharacterized protein LOC115775538 n=1 Tax=Archocentrus centrarchus TaxID=63155 RepID=UPI0011E9C5A9